MAFASDTTLHTGTPRTICLPACLSTTVRLRIYGSLENKEKRDCKDRHAQKSTQYVRRTTDEVTNQSLWPMEAAIQGFIPMQYPELPPRSYRAYSLSTHLPSPQPPDTTNRRVFHFHHRASLPPPVPVKSPRRRPLHRSNQPTAP